MNLGIENNLKIAEKYCLNPEGCPKLKGIADYDERLSRCAGCTNYLNKIDLVELLQYYSTNTPTPPPIPSTPKPPRTGKGTELSKTQIKKILTLHNDGYTATAIARELGLQYRTVKNTINLTFKNETSNEKIKKIQDEMRNDGLMK